jgi:chromate transporter
MGTPLREIAALFLQLGTTAFGGPAAHIALMEEEVVRRRGWMTRGQFLDYLGATNLIPGPNSTELAIHIGHARGGWPGLVVAGACFIVPAALVAATFAWAYVQYGSLPQMAGVLYGVKPVVIAVVAQALWTLGRTALKSATLLVLGSCALLGTVLGLGELTLLALAALTALAVIWLPHRVARSSGPGRAGLLAGLLAVGPTSVVSAATTATASGVPFSLGTLFGVFAKVGAVLFGSGYVLLAFLRADLVERLGWLTEQQLLDAVAIGQLVPGPVFTTATFIGYFLGGPWGAVVATVGIFLPAFVFVAVSGPLVPRLRRSPAAGAVLDGVNVASLALMGAVSWQLARSALVDPLTVALAVAALVALVHFRVRSSWLILAGAIVGAVVSSIR